MVENAIRSELQRRGYTCQTIRLSSILSDCVELGIPVRSPNDREYAKLTGLMNLGDQLRSRPGCGDAFQLISVYCPESVRKAHLMEHAMSEEEACSLIRRDAGDENEYGQQLRDTFCMADAFVSIACDGDQAINDMQKQIGRYLKLVFTEGAISPTADEHAMNLAYAASLRSADLSRQVGAAIMSPTRELVSVGANEVPAPGGGQYW